MLKVHVCKLGLANYNLFIFESPDYSILRKLNKPYYLGSIVYDLNY